MKKNRMSERAKRRILFTRHLHRMSTLLLITLSYGIIHGFSFHGFKLLSR